MHKQLIYVGSGLFAMGALFGWAVTADHYEKKIREEREGYDDLIRDKTEHIFDLKDRVEFLQRENAPFEPMSDKEGDVFINPEPEVEVEVEVEDDWQPAPGETVEDTRSNLQAIIDQYTKSPEDSSEFMRNVEPEIDRSKPPFIISTEEFAYGDDEGEEYEKIAITYYKNDRMLLDDEDEPIDDVNRFVGWKNLTKFGENPDDPYTLYIRNHGLKTDFEVMLDDENPLPLHVRYGMTRTEFDSNKAAGLIKFRREDM